MVAIAVGESRTVRAMRRVPTSFPLDWWPGEPMVETGKMEKCGMCRRVVDACDMNGGWCVECDMKAFHPVGGWAFKVEE